METRKTDIDVDSSKRQGLAWRVMFALSILALLSVLALQLVHSLYLNRKSQRDLEAFRSHLVEKAQAGIRWDKNTLQATALDYSEWDDMYDFVQNPTPEFVESGLGEASHENNRIAHLILVKTDHSLVFGSHLDESYSEWNQTQWETLKASRGLVWPKQLDQSESGILVWQERPYLFAITPVTRSGGGGDVIGHMMMTRLLNFDWNEEMGKILGVRITWTAELGLSDLDDPKLTVIYPLENAQLQALGFLHITDLDHKPLESALGDRLLTPAAVMVALLMLGAATWLMRRYVLQPISFLTTQVSKLARDADTHDRLETNYLVSEFRTLAGSINNLLDEREANRDLRAARDTAVQADRLKSALLANTSHELRTPLHGIIGTTDLALKESMNDRARSYVESAGQIARNLGEIIDDILDLSRLDAGHLALAPRATDLRQLIQYILQQFRTKAQSKHLNLRSDVDSAIAPLLRVDDSRLAQVLKHLLSNAVKFSERGEIVVGVRHLGLTPQGQQIQISVQDQGIGIAAEKLASIFEPFVQADSSTTRAFGGTGLGLAICKRLVEAMNGRITVHSMPHIGTTFMVDLELETAISESQPSPAKPPVLAKPLMEYCVLVVDDDPVNQTIAATCLEQAGLRVESASNGIEAMDHYRHLIPDLILMDKNMPLMDGLEATRAIRNLEAGSERHVTILALTAGAQMSDRVDCLACGMDDVLVKPMAPDALVRAVLNRLPHKRSD